MTYEVVGVIDKKRLVVIEIDEDGEVLEVETQIPVSDVPKKVMKAIPPIPPMARSWSLL